MRPQPLEETGSAVRFRDERGDKPMAMPSPTAHANMTFRGRAGTLKSGSPMNSGNNAAMPTIRAKRRRK